MSKYRWNPVVNVGCLVSNEQNAQASVDPDDLGYVVASWVRCSEPLLLREQGPSVEVRMVSPLLIVGLNLGKRASP